MFTVEQLLSIAKEKKASDVHVTVGLPPRVRINGELVDLDYPKLSPDDCEKLILDIMDDRQQAMFKDRGELDFSFSVPNIGRYRVNVFRQRGSVACAMRIVGTEIPKPESLGVPKSVVDLYAKKRGLVLVTGPTGSGKSTTLASLIDKINDERNAHVITLEDPIEYLHSHRKAMINQREIGLDTHSYADALRAALREDPDVILVGEMRDYETINAAITAAETGHLVLSTLHTRSATQTVERIISACPIEAQSALIIQIASVLTGVITQTLVPRAEQEGRIAATEIMLNNTAVSNLIKEKKTNQIQTVLQSNMQTGMHTMNYSLANLVKTRVISRDVALKYSENPTELAKSI